MVLAKRVWKAREPELCPACCARATDLFSVTLLSIGPGTVTPGMVYSKQRTVGAVLAAALWNCNAQGLQGLLGWCEGFTSFVPQRASTAFH